ncbi:MAG: molybdopterin-synthase adenylyltransferase MoeB [Chlorobi bacterium]|nr:MAG: UBA/THIF-type NAD/FAD binding protein [Chlorobi bacterium OLB7]MBK8910822.1 molybdopterin-synthase adenylyltransferase MoeB [Chlorobiota bacterium]MBX7216089.1 molybdopterin-synthase adenylyltransferase MoeB [Candidatus Kapabacteria bacterium]
MPARLTPEELGRYSRHILLPEFGMAGQQRLKESSVLLIGAGGLGSPLALYLAAAGVGKIGIVDSDVVDESNLQRQVLHGSSDVGRKKVESAQERMMEVNRHIEVATHDQPFTSANAMQIATGYSAIVDGTDNFPTRYLSNDVAVFLGIPNIYGSIFRFEGQVSTFWSKHGPCYRCLYPEPPPPGSVPSCAEGGVLGVLPGVIGTLQATEVIKVLTGIGKPLIGRLLLYDALAMGFRELRFARDPDCPICSNRPTITQLIDYEAFCGVPAHDRVSNQQPDKTTMPVPEITVEQLAELRSSGTPHTLIDVREPHEYELCNIGGTLIPLGQLPERYSEIPRDGTVVIHCRSGARSTKAIEYLQSLGYANVANLTGGIRAWSDVIDPNVPKY